MSLMIKMNDYMMIESALRFAERKHKGQFRKDGKTPFMTHPKMVFQLLDVLVPDDKELLAAALLHDTIEDTQTTYNELVRHFGYGVSDLVLEVTKSEENTFPNLKTRRGVILKFADRLANLCDMENMTEKFQLWYLRKSVFWKI